MIIEWSMRLFDNDSEIVKRHKEDDVSNFYNGWPEMFAKNRAEEFFQMDQWDEWFGFDCGDGDVIVEIFEPEDCRGKWHVSLELKAEATSTKIEEKATA